MMIRTLRKTAAIFMLMTFVLFIVWTGWLPITQIEERSSVVGPGSNFNINAADVFVVLHIPKTGMGAITQLLTKHLITETPCYCQPGKSRCSCVNSEGNPWLFNAYNVTGFPCGEYVDFTNLTKCPIDYWMETSGKDTRQQRRYTVLTQLRDPVARYISEWLHFRRQNLLFRNEPRLWRSQSAELQKKVLPCLLKKKIPTLSLEDFISCEGNPANNRQTRMLANLTRVRMMRLKGKAFDEALLRSAKNTLQTIPFFGILNQIEKTQTLLRHDFGLHFDKELTFLSNEADEYQPKVDPSVHHQIVQANSLDMRLYRFAVELFESRYKTATYIPPADSTLGEGAGAALGSEDMASQREEFLGISPDNANHGLDYFGNHAIQGDYIVGDTEEDMVIIEGEKARLGGAGATGSTGETPAPLLDQTGSAPAKPSSLFSNLYNKIFNTELPFAITPVDAPPSQPSEPSEPIELNATLSTGIEIESPATPPSTHEIPPVWMGTTFNDTLEPKPSLPSASKPDLLFGRPQFNQSDQKWLPAGSQNQNTVQMQGSGMIQGNQSITGAEPYPGSLSKYRPGDFPSSREDHGLDNFDRTMHSQETARSQFPNYDYGRSDYSKSGVELEHRGFGTYPGQPGFGSSHSELSLSERELGSQQGSQYHGALSPSQQPASQFESPTSQYKDRSQGLPFRPDSGGFGAAEKPDLIAGERSQDWGGLGTAEKPDLIGGERSQDWGGLGTAEKPDLIGGERSQDWGDLGTAEKPDLIGGERSQDWGGLGTAEKPDLIGGERSQHWGGLGTAEKPDLIGGERSQDWGGFGARDSRFDNDDHTKDSFKDDDHFIKQQFPYDRSQPIRAPEDSQRFGFGTDMTNRKTDESRNDILGSQQSTDDGALPLKNMFGSTHSDGMQSPSSINLSGPQNTMRDTPFLVDREHLDVPDVLGGPDTKTEGGPGLNIDKHDEVQKDEYEDYVNQKESGQDYVYKQENGQENKGISQTDKLSAFGDESLAKSSTGLTGADGMGQLSQDSNFNLKISDGFGSGTNAQSGFDKSLQGTNTLGTNEFNPFGDSLKAESGDKALPGMPEWNSNSPSASPTPSPSPTPTPTPTPTSMTTPSSSETKESWFNWFSSKDKQEATESGNTDTLTKEPEEDEVNQFLGSINGPKDTSDTSLSKSGQSQLNEFSVPSTFSRLNIEEGSLSNTGSLQSGSNTGTELSFQEFASEMNSASQDALKKTNDFSFGQEGKDGTQNNYDDNYENENKGKVEYEEEYYDETKNKIDNTKSEGFKIDSPQVPGDFGAGSLHQLVQQNSPQGFVDPNLSSGDRLTETQSAAREKMHQAHEDFLQKKFSSQQSPSAGSTLNVGSDNQKGSLGIPVYDSGRGDGPIPDVKTGLSNQGGNLGFNFQTFPTQNDNKGLNPSGQDSIEADKRSTFRLGGS